MLIISQNLAKYKMTFSEEPIFRINLAWINNIEELEKILKLHENQQIFLDLPIGRTKPPNSRYAIEDLIPIIRSHKHVKYFAISNVESPEDLKIFINTLPKDIIIIPKIESPLGIENINEITNVLPNSKIIMLDHDDLYRSIEKQKMDPLKFQEYIAKLVDFCSNSKVILLRTRGVIFSDI